MTFGRLLSCRAFATQAKSSFYVTTPIFYVNAAPHIGHLYSAVIADAINRYQKIKNPGVQTFFATGTDEHGTKIQQAANTHKTPVSTYCDNISNRYKEVFKLANISNDTFIRTTEQRHQKAVEHFWKNLHKRGHIYKAKYQGWYCVSDETFLTETQLKENPDGTKVSTESGHPVEWTEETNYMFKMSDFQDKVANWIEKGTKVKPKKFEKILLDYLKEPLPDISVSRPSNRVSWAIPVPGDDSQTVYVWLDALVNYFSAIGYPEDNERLKNMWPASVQVLGKDILKFHGIYWPAFLMACDMEPPQQLLVHSHWTVDGQKMSKSKFNVVDPMDVCDIYTMEGLRYFLLREGVAHNDGNYSSTKAVRILNSELADTFGNLLSRGCAKSLNKSQTFPAMSPDHYNELCKLEVTKRLIALVEQLPEKSQQHYEDYYFYLVVDQVIATLHAANNFFETCKPWEMKKAPKDSEDFHKLQTITAITLDTLRVCALILQPILPTMTAKLLDKLNVECDERSFDCSRVNFTNVLKDKETNLTNENAVLFKRILLDSNENKVASKG